MSPGTPQTERFPPALAPNWFSVDETSIFDLLTMSWVQAGVLTYAGPRGRDGGDWRALLEHDESVLIARGLGVRLDALAQEFLDDYAAARVDGLLTRLTALTTWLEDWRGALTSVDRPWAQALGERVATLVRHFVTPTLAATTATPAGVRLQIERQIHTIAAHDAARAAKLQDLRRLYFGLLKAIEEIQGLLRAEWEASLGSEVHEPAAALLLAFLQTFDRVRSRMNTFTERHTSFYYDDCLGMAARGAEPDCVHLTFQRDSTYEPAVVIPMGAPFPAGRYSSGEAVEFRADDQLTVTDVRVEALCSLRLQRDPLTSPESDLYFVTRAKVDGFPVDAGLDDDAVPLLGGDVRGSTGMDEDARIGLAISSPIFALKEGERQITLTLSFNFGDETVEGLLEQLEAAAKLVEAPRKPSRGGPRDTQALRILGRLFAWWVLPDQTAVTDAHLAAIRELAARVVEIGAFVVKDGVVDVGRGGSVDDDGYSATDPLVLFLAQGIFDEGDDLRNMIRDGLIEDLFTAALSTADGWREIEVVQAKPVGAESAGPAITLALDLTNEDPPVVACSRAVHGHEWPTEAPILRLTINQQAPIFPFSIVQGALLDAIDINVKVQGVRDVRLYNQLGPLDPSRPFMPFGPLPDTTSYIVLGAPELARKRITALSAHADWAGLPATGFATYYANYDGDFRDTSFSVTPAIMRDGLWIESDRGAEPVFFAGERLRARPIVFDPAALAAQWRPTDAELVLNQDARSGFVKIRLASPPQGFGHRAYPDALTKALSAKLKRGKARSMPNPPYTPLVERITVTYEAQTRIEISGGRLGMALEAGERVLHLHPFGVEELQSTAGLRHTLVPSFDRDGHLFIGLAGKDVQGVLTLLFDLRQDSAVEVEARRTPRPRIEWSWLAGDGWRRLDERCVLSDTTACFLTTGVVTLDLPAGIAAGNPTMPGGLVWLRMSSDAASGCFAGLRGVRAQALRATRVLGTAAPDAPLAARTISLKGAALPGVLALDQPKPGIGLRFAETKTLQQTRIGERLRHKNRASTAWDYERLVLEKFPNVYKVRCVPCPRDQHGRRTLGRVLVVVVPMTPRNDGRYNTRPMKLDPLELDRIEAYLRERASAFADIKVRNASYDLIQVRCRVALGHGVDVGDTVRRINAAIVSHLSPWCDAGLSTQFDWEIRVEDIENCLRQFGEVTSVRGISLIHVWEEQDGMDDPVYRFDDTARSPASAPASDPDAATSMRVRRKQPWSLALPVDEHLIEITSDRPGDALTPTGLAAGTDGATGPVGVQIGATFVMGDVG